MLQTLAVGWRASALRCEEAGHFRKVAGMSIDVAGRGMCPYSQALHVIPRPVYMKKVLL